MTSLLDLVLRLFARIVWGSEEEWFRRKKLREMVKSLRERHSDWMDPSGKRLEPGFASAMLNLCRTVQMVSSAVPALASISVGNEGERYVNAKKLLFGWMDSETENRIADLDYDARRRAAHGSDSLDAIGEMEKNYGTVVNWLDGEVAAEYVSGFQHLLLLSELSRYDFQGLLTQFDPSFSVSNPRYISAFSAVSALQPLEELLDFHYIWSGFDVSAALEKNLLILSGDREQEDDIDQLFYHLRNYQSRIIGADDLLLMIRIIKAEPDFEPAVHPAADSPVKAFQSELRKKFEAVRIRLEREILEKKIRSRIQLLFQERPLASVPVYNDETGIMIFERGITGFLHTLPLKVVKNYLTLLYEGRVPPELRKLLSDGFFPDPGFSRSLEKLLSESEHLLKAVTDFERQAGSLEYGERFMGSEELVAMLSSTLLAQEDKDAVACYAEKMNREAGKLVDTAGRLFGDLYRRLDSIAGDAREREPRIVTNIRTISGENFKNLADAVRAFKAELEQLLEILREFTVISASPGR